MGWINDGELSVVLVIHECLLDSDDMGKMLYELHLLAVVDACMDDDIADSD